MKSIFKHTKKQQASNRKKWLKALRSGDYKQTQGALKKRIMHDDEDAYCCLGVACELFHKAYPDNSNWSNDGDFNVNDENGVLIEASSARLPEPVRDWLGLKDESGEYSTLKGKTTTLVDLNDVRKYSFKQIANIVERVKGLTV